MLLLPILYLLYINAICKIYAQHNKQCSNCKYFIPYKNNKISDFGLCKMFGYKVGDKKDKIIFNFAKHCRDDDNLCGKNGSLYEEIGKNNINNTIVFNDLTKENITKPMEDEMKNLINDYYIFLRNDNDW